MEAAQKKSPAEAGLKDAQGCSLIAPGTLAARLSPAAEGPSDLELRPA
jgi:hypothetical protein